MKTIKKAFLLLLCAIVSASAGYSFAQEKVLTQLQTDLVGSWLAEVEGAGRDRTLIVTNVSQKSEETFSLDASFGFLPRGQPVSVAEISQNAIERKLSLTARSGAKIVATQTPDKAFVGSFFGTDGRTYGVKITKISDDALAADIAAAGKKRRDDQIARAISLPGRDVPASCASLIGGWTGNWGVHGGGTMALGSAG